ncbi:hypothetical protein OKE68_02780 [Riemerella anatipestifer]|uniref:Lipoprotein n=1 Tax=Riemerella anatipestifer TaxID=34085 RepID=A0AAP3ETI1_RIEAN|nr:hypothetical protein [Riemerella anatipestifer]MBT0572778.1 hypothetical protein [Riemerella anatipestifer]MCE3024546.1 hypothetical protein [Riemerella anatipestifer]MCU7568339.1 hypothetical protein [Riemerella anatipestifer]MCW0489333.1 hypothetical protein [Riemerella anatipestifer]MCW0523242.1 hypothetical protein [Riemerella anatipestifer]
MRKTLLFLVTLFFISCFEDKNGNAPLIEDENGYLVDNPNYKTDRELEYDEKMQTARENYRNSKKDDGSTIDLGGRTPTVEDREQFGKNFKPKTGSTTIELIGKEKTTIKLISGFNTDFTLEQYERLNYFDKMRELGFKKAIFNNGRKDFKTYNLE